MREGETARRFAVNIQKNSNEVEHDGAVAASDGRRALAEGQSRSDRARTTCWRQKRRLDPSRSPGGWA